MIPSVYLASNGDNLSSTVCVRNGDPSADQMDVIIEVGFHKLQFNLSRRKISETS